MTKEEVRFQVALSCIQGVLEAEHGIIGEIVPEIAVKESLRIADEFVRQWFGETKQQSEQTCRTCDFYENRCPFSRGKLIPYPNKACNNYVHSAIKERSPAERNEKDENYLWLIHQAISCAYANKVIDAQTCSNLRKWLNGKILL